MRGKNTLSLCKLLVPGQLGGGGKDCKQRVTCASRVQLPHEALCARKSRGRKKPSPLSLVMQMTFKMEATNIHHASLLEMRAEDILAG